MHTYKNTRKSKRSGFTLIEMIGVLAIIAVLAGLLLPRIFAAINEARVNSAALGYNSVKSAAMTYFGKYGRFAGTNGSPIVNGIDADTTNKWDQTVLLKGGFLEKPFSTKISTEANVMIMPALSATDPAVGTNAAFNLDGTSVNNATGGASVLVVKLTGVPLEDAKELNAKIDGESAALGETTSGQDVKGRVKYDFGAAQVGDVFMYIAHK